jgi:predicted lipoprotein with Yx(FWY)xxD motif
MKTLALLGATLALATPAAAGTVVKATYNKVLKTTIIVDARGMTLYEYVSDVPNTQPYPFCVDDPTYHCSKHWVPLLTTGAPTAGAGAKQSLLGTVDRSDGGGTQVTYKGRPLYTWKGGYGSPRDKKPGDVFGQAFLSIWYVMSPAGKVIKKPRP